MTTARAVGMFSLSTLLAASNGRKTVNTGKRDEEISEITEEDYDSKPLLLSVSMSNSNSGSRWILK
jgi:hypothetical protein